MLFPISAGVDVSDLSIRFIAIAPRGSTERVLLWGEEPLPSGAVESGVIRNSELLVNTLKTVRARLGSEGAAHAALPEEAAYVFSMKVPFGSSRDETLTMIEFELPDRVPISPKLAVFDFDVIGSHGGETEIGVSVFPRELAEAYAHAFDAAGIELLSLELETRSIARAVSDEEEKFAVLLVDFGRERTGFAVLKRGIPIFTSTVEIGGATIARTIAKKLPMSFEAVEEFFDNEGLLAGKRNGGAVEILTKGVSVFADEVARHYNYWDTRRNEAGERVTPVSRVLLVGGSANIKGLADFVASRVQVAVEIPNVWQRVASFESYIPPIDRSASLQYATAIGLALRAHT